MSALQKLLLIAHGSASIDDAGRVIAAHAAQIASGGGFAAVTAGFLNGAPSVENALAALGGGPVLILPFFMGEGYFTRIVVPEQVQAACRNLGCASEDMRFLPPIGMAPALADLAERRAGEMLVQHGLKPADCALVLAGHGNPRSKASSRLVHGHAQALAARNGFAAVSDAFLEEAPFLSDVLRHHDGRATLVIGMFNGEGGHVIEDVPQSVTEENERRKAAGNAHTVLLGPSLGSDPAMPSLVAEFVKNQL